MEYKLEISRGTDSEFSICSQKIYKIGKKFLNKKLRNKEKCCFIQKSLLLKDDLKFFQF